VACIYAARDSPRALAMYIPGFEDGCSCCSDSQEFDHILSCSPPPFIPNHITNTAQASSRHAAKNNCVFEHRYRRRASRLYRHLCFVAHYSRQDGVYVSTRKVSANCECRALPKTATSTCSAISCSQLLSTQSRNHVH